MRLAIAFLLICCFGQVAFGDEQHPENKIFDYKTIEGDLLTPYIKPKFRTCRTHNDCSYIAKVCGGPYPVNNFSKERVGKVIDKWNSTLNCPVSNIKPSVDCVKGLCEIVPNHAK